MCTRWLSFSGGAGSFSSGVLWGGSVKTRFRLFFVVFWSVLTSFLKKQAETTTINANLLKMRPKSELQRQGEPKGSSKGWKIPTKGAKSDSNCAKYRPKASKMGPKGAQGVQNGAKGRQKGDKGRPRGPKWS